MLQVSDIASYSIPSGILSQLSFENKSNAVIYGHFSNRTDKRTLNILKAIYLGNVYVQKKIIAVV